MTPEAGPFLVTRLNEPTFRKCPRCTQTVEPVAISCPFCGFTLESAQLLYGDDPLPVDRAMDPAGRLSAAERRELIEALERFEEVFPQLCLRVWLGNLPVPASPRQFAFWLLNQGCAEEEEPVRTKERSLLLAIDPEGGTAILGCGYFVESFVSEAELDVILAGASQEIRAGHYAGAVNRITSGLSKLLRRFAPDPGMPCEDAGGPSLAKRTSETEIAAPGPVRGRTSRRKSTATRDNPRSR